MRALPLAILVPPNSKIGRRGCVEIVKIEADPLAGVQGSVWADGEEPGESAWPTQSQY
jgi:hypothetical protein